MERFRTLRNQKRKRSVLSMAHSDLVELVHQISGVEKYRVKQVLKAVSRAVLQHLKIGASVTFMGLGQFRTVKRKYAGKPQIRIAFRGATKLKKTLGREHKRKTMDKYGVELDKSKEVTARVTGKCPDCDAQLPTTADGAVQPNCPNCGVRPFESEAVRTGRLPANKTHQTAKPRRGE